MSFAATRTLRGSPHELQLCEFQLISLLNLLIPPGLYAECVSLYLFFPLIDKDLIITTNVLAACVHLCV